jgi:hypothetical protein
MVKAAVVLIVTTPKQNDNKQYSQSVHREPGGVQ